MSTADPSTGTAGKTLAELDFVGGHPALDFVNTVDSRFKAGAPDFIHSYGDLVDWHVKAGLLDAATARAFRGAAAADSRSADAGLRTGLKLRATLYRIFLGVAHGEPPAPADIEDLNVILAPLRSLQRLTGSGAGIEWQWRMDAGRPESILGPVAAAAAELLTSGRLQRVKECPSPDGCGWLFLDTSRNGSRHWCSMKDCGNVAKVRRHRKRQARAG